MRYRSKPTEIKAVQWTGENVADLNELGASYSNGPEGLRLLAGKDGAQGYVPVPVGHWIVCNPGDMSDHWPVDPDYFAAKYEGAFP